MTMVKTLILIFLTIALGLLISSCRSESTENYNGPEPEAWQCGHKVLGAGI